MKRKTISAIVVLIVLLGSYGFSTIGSSAARPPKPLFLNPNYYANEDRYYTNLGAYASVSPKSVGFGDGHGEFWCSVVAVDYTNHYFAEAAVDVTYDMGRGQWHTVVYSGYSNPGIWPQGTYDMTNTYDMGYSSSPQSPTIAVYDHLGNSSGVSWDFVANNWTFNTHYYGVHWTGTCVSVTLESYAQPLANSNGQVLAADSYIYYKNTGGIWTGTSAGTDYGKTGFNVAQSNVGPIHSWTSTQS
jgi:hypothetical protein